MATDTPASPRARPVTPVGIAGAMLTEVVARVEDGADVADVLDDLRRAAQLVTGLEQYVEEHSTPPSHALRDLAERTACVPWPDLRRDGGPLLEREMLSGAVEGMFLSFLVRATRARRVLEIGMFTGYAALAMAEGLAHDGIVVACELEAAPIAVAREAFAASPAGQRVRVEQGPALATLTRLADASETFDLVFVDADKAGYGDYLNAVLDLGLLAPGGLVCVDNTLLQGEPWTGSAGPNGRAVANFNRQLAADERVDQVVLPLRDGVTLVRRAGE